VSSSAKRLPDEPADNGQKGSWMDEQDILTRLSKWNDPVTEKSAQSMESLLRQVDRKNLTRQHLIIATEAWRTVGRLDKAAGTLDWMLELGRDSPRLEPFRAVWRPIFLALLREKNVKKAKSILVKMEQLRIISQQPDLEEYKLLLRDMARRGAAADAEALVKQMVDRCKRFDSESYKLPKSYGACQSTPDRETYQLLLDAHAKSRSPRSGQRAMEILVELHALAEQSSSLITPDSQMYASVVSAIAYNFPILKHAVEMIDELLKQAARKGVDLDAQLFNTCLNGYARLASGHTAKRADLILEEMRRRDIATAESYNLVLKAWMKSGRPESYQRSLIILRQMEECKLANSVSYTRVIGVASQRGTREAAEEATECLIKLRKLCRVERSGSNRPNKQAYNHVLHAWISCGDVERAESILKEMEQIPTTADSALSSPNVVSYSIVIDG
jgi:pentatricopeptide repeat protein